VHREQEVAATLPAAVNCRVTHGQSSFLFWSSDSFQMQALKENADDHHRGQGGVMVRVDCHLD
jgi:hypothetical protein